MNETFQALRRQILQDEYAQLNDMQRQAVFFTDSPLLILAGAGSGKTTVIINKIGYLIRYGHTYQAEPAAEPTAQDTDFLRQCLQDKQLRKTDRYMQLMQEDPIAAGNILAITFTNKAAQEMRTRLQTQFDISADRLWALTFHSLCVRILRSFIHLLGFDRSFTIYDDADSNKLMDGIIKDMGLDERYDVKAVRSAISRAKTAYVSAEDFDLVLKNSQYPQTGRIYKKYQDELRQANALDFDDLIFFTVKLLSEYPEVKQKVNRRFKYVLVDEYQDTNPLQYKLVSHLASHGNICVVGDDDQSIYRFLGATIENILSFEKSFENARIIKLEQNYRSTSNILDAANAVISHNKARKGKNLWTASGQGEKIKYRLLESSVEEAEFVAKTVLTGVSKGEKYSDFCVLYRTHSQSRQIEMALKGNGIPYKVYGGLAFFKRKEIQDVLAYLNVIANPSDKTRLTRVINVPKRGIGETTVKKALQLAESKYMSIFDVLERADEFPELARAADKLKAFAQLINHLREQVTQMSLSEFYPYLLEATGYKQMTEGLELREKLSRQDNLQEFLNAITDYETRAERPSLVQFLEEMSLISAVDDLDEGDNSVVLMTMHCAKGLEFNNVFITGFEEGLFPSERSIWEDGGEEEERRLCYVAITRARKILYMTSAKLRMRFGTVRPSMPSRFYKEIPQQLIEAQESRPAAKTFAAPAPYRPPQTAHIPADIFGSKPKSAECRYQPGMRVMHRVFGAGTVKTATPMASDTMLEVEFAAGTKKLMANYAKMEILPEKA